MLRYGQTSVLVVGVCLSPNPIKLTRHANTPKRLCSPEPLTSAPAVRHATVDCCSQILTQYACATQHAGQMYSLYLHLHQRLPHQLCDAPSVAVEAHHPLTQSHYSLSPYPRPDFRPAATGLSIEAAALSQIWLTPFLSAVSMTFALSFTHESSIKTP